MRKTISVMMFLVIPCTEKDLAYYTGGRADKEQIGMLDRNEKYDWY